ncbi:MAG: cupin domain-containing protein [Celeribacter sp.]|jgi:anti-sigma factor ChrR (cupin superfamily)
MSGPIVFHDLLNGGWRDQTFEPFRDGVEICHLHRDQSDAVSSPHWALLRYAPGASVPEHLHTGLETILVLEGAQGDAAGTYPAGTMVLNPEGSSHAVQAAQGCVVLIQWARPVEILDDA